MVEWWIKYQGHIESLNFKYPERNFLNLKSVHNISLATYRFDHQSPKALIFLFHGLHMSSSIFTHLGKSLHSQGFAVLAFDQQGHGLSGGVRGTVSSLEDYSNDCLSFILKCRDLYPSNLPIFLIGLSMGGSMCVSVSLKRPDLIKGIILFGPALAVDPNFQPVVQKTVSFLNNCCCRNLRVFAVDQALVCRNPLYKGYFQENPEFFHEKLNVRTINALLTGFRNVQQNALNFDGSVLVIQGEKDKIVSCQQAKDFVKNCKSSDKEIVVYPEMFHVVTHEPEFPEVIERCIHWLNARV
jgi:alpha-beta hydrolase superfamily lysophospholipase